MSHPHLSDDRLIELYFDVETSSSDRAHLQICETCQSRRENLSETLDDIETVMTAEADEAFPADRLARQRARILQRVDQDGRPGRVIVFPAGHTSDTPTAPRSSGPLGHGRGGSRRVISHRTPGRAPGPRPPGKPAVDAGGANPGRRSDRASPNTRVRRRVARAGRTGRKRCRACRFETAGSPDAARLGRALIVPGAFRAVTRR